MNDLVVSGQDVVDDRGSPNGVDTLGANIVDSGNRLLDNVRNGEFDNPATYGHLAVFGFDTLGYALDPFGTIVKSTVGWLFRHVAFLREPIEFLSGDPNVVRGLSDTWNNISEALAGAATDYEELLQDVRNWTGDAADAYRSLASSFATGLNGLSGYASHLSGGLRTAAVAVATTRGLIFETIVNWVRDVVKRAVVAFSMGYFTGGGSVALFLTSTIADAAALLARTLQKVRKLLDMLRRVTDRFGVLRKGADQLDDALRRTQQSLGKFATRQAVATGNAQSILDAEKNARKHGTSRIARESQRLKDVVDKTGHGLPKEAFKQANREMDREPVDPE